MSEFAGTEYGSDDPVMQLIWKAKVGMLFDHEQFFGQLATNLKPVDASSWCKTAATDGKHFYFNREYILGLSIPKLKFLIAHETGHMIAVHMARRGNRDPRIWNMAIDYWVNYILVKQRIGQMPEYGLYDRNYHDGLSSEEIYDLLIENAVEVKVPMLDEHLEVSPSGGQKGDGEGQDGEKSEGTCQIGDGTNGPPEITQEDIAGLQEDVRNMLVRTSMSVGSKHIPHGFQRIIDDLINPKIDWRSMLDAHIRSAIRHSRTYTRLSRRVWGLKKRTGRTYILPGPSQMKKIDICVAMDTSGSMSDAMLRDICTEIKGIMQTFRDYRLRVWSFDDISHPDTYAEFTPQNINEFDDWRGRRVKGGGGTQFQAVYDFMRARDIDPHRLVVFTDGYPNAGDWGEPNYCDTLFVIHAPTQVAQKIKAPYGVTTYYDPA